MINANIKNPLQKYAHKYKDNFNHSARLKEVFGTFKFKGCDYPNDNGIKIEFKECVVENKPINKVRFACYYKDLLDSDYIVFIFNDMIFLHKTRLILGKYGFKSDKAIAQPYLTTVRRNYLEKFDDLNKLKEYIDKLKK